MEDVPLSAARRDKILPELSSQVRNMHVDQIRKTVFRLIEQMLEDLSARHHFAAMQREQLQQRILSRRQQQQRLCSFDGLRARINREFANLNLRRCLASRPTNQSSQSRLELRQMKRFGEIVVGTAIESADSVVNAVASR